MGCVERVSQRQLSKLQGKSRKSGNKCLVSVVYARSAALGGGGGEAGKDFSCLSGTVVTTIVSRD